jgi:hypothetical protein
VVPRKKSSYFRNSFRGILNLSFILVLGGLKMKEKIENICISAKQKIINARKQTRIK